MCPKLRPKLRPKALTRPCGVSGRDAQYRSGWALLEIYLSLGERIYFRMGRVRSRFLILTDSGFFFFFFFLNCHHLPSPLEAGFFPQRQRSCYERQGSGPRPLIIPESPHYQAVPGIPRAAKDLETAKQMKKATLARA